MEMPNPAKNSRRDEEGCDHNEREKTVVGTPWRPAKSAGLNLL